jgi:hypothetical protein
VLVDCRGAKAGRAVVDWLRGVDILVAGMCIVPNVEQVTQKTRRRSRHVWYLGSVLLFAVGSG